MNLQFEISDQEIERLDEMLKETGLDSYKALFNSSLSLFYWAVHQTKNNKVVGAVDENGQKYTELISPPLSHITETMKAAAAQAQQISVTQPVQSA